MPGMVGLRIIVGQVQRDWGASFVMEGRILLFFRSFNLLISDELNELQRTGEMASKPMMSEKEGLNWRSLRPAVPLLFLPAGILFCLAHGLLIEGEAYGFLSMLKWGVLVLSPWVVAALLFERSLRTAETRRQLLARAAVMALVAYTLSTFGSLWMGLELERSLLSRLPLVATALLVASIYPLKPLPAKVVDARDPCEEELPVDASHVLYAVGAGNYVELHCGSRTALWRQTLSDAEEVLRPAGFVRVHRSYLVARHAIDNVHRSRKGAVEVALINGQRLPVSSSYAANVTRTMQ